MGTIDSRLERTTVRPKRPAGATRTRSDKHCGSGTQHCGAGDDGDGILRAMYIGGIVDESVTSAYFRQPSPDAPTLPQAITSIVELEALATLGQILRALDLSDQVSCDIDLIGVHVRGHLQSIRNIRNAMCRQRLDWIIDEED